MILWMEETKCLIFAVRFSLLTYRLVGGGVKGEDFLRSIKLALVKTLVNLQSLRTRKVATEFAAKNRASPLSYTTLYVCMCKENI